MEKWKQDFIDLAKSITDVNDDPDFQFFLIFKGTQNEENARILTEFIHENNIDCRGLWKDLSVYPIYEKLVYKILELPKNKTTTKAE